jgi:hypothetical protein
LDQKPPGPWAPTGPIWAPQLFRPSAGVALSEVHREVGHGEGLFFADENGPIWCGSPRSDVRSSGFYDFGHAPLYRVEPPFIVEGDIISLKMT